MKQILTLDSSQIACFLACPRQWHYSYRMRLSSISGPPSTAMIMGTYLHHLLDNYYKAIAKGETISQAREAGMAFEPEQHVLCRICGQPCNNHNPLITEDDIHDLPDPVPFPLSPEDRKMVKMRFMDYTMTYAANDFIPHSPESVEVGFSEAIYEDDDYLFVLEGKIDLLASFKPYDRVVVDHKSQMRKHDLYTRRIQFKNYAMIDKANVFIINYIRFNKVTTPDTYQRVAVPFSQAQHEQWRKYLIGIYKNIARAVKDSDSDPNYWLKSASNPNWASCDGLYGYECQFTGICEEPGLAEQKIKNLYHIKEEWKPW